MLAIRGTCEEESWTNVLHASLLEGPDPVLIGDWIEWVDDFIGAIDSGLLYSNQSYTLHVTDVHGVYRTSVDTYLDAVRGSTIVGGDPGSPSSANDSAVISWLGGWHYKGGKPRTYMAGLPEGVEATTTTLTSDYVESLRVDANDFLSAVNALGTTAFPGCSLGTISYQSGGVWRDPPVFFPYDGAVVHTRIASQRRRLGRWLP